MKTLHLGLLTFGAAALISACGGGGDGQSWVSGSDVPASATQSSKAAVDFVAQVTVGSGDASPLVLGDATLATSDTAEPEAI